MRHFAYIQPGFFRDTPLESAYDKRVFEQPESSMLLVRPSDNLSMQATRQTEI